MEIVVIGTAFMDVKGFPGGTYVPSSCNAGRVECNHGGVARNVAEDVARLGLQVTYLGLVDPSPMGRAVEEHLRSQGVNTDHVLARPDGMGVWMAVFDENGELAASVSKRPDMGPLAEILDERGDGIFSAADSVIIEADLPRKVVEKAAALAKIYHVPLFAAVSNMAAVPAQRDLLGRFSCLICNCAEASTLFNADFSRLGKEELITSLSREIRTAGIPAIVVTLGADGSVYVSQAEENGYCPARPVERADATGAGDAFCAGVAAGLTCRKSMSEAVELGTYLASGVVTSFSNVCPRMDPRELGLI